MLWTILQELAEARRCENYARIDEILGLNAQNVSGALAPIHDYCERNDLPLLTALVVQTKTGRPGPGYRCRNDHATECARVFAHDWVATAMPSADRFRA